MEKMDNPFLILMNRINELENRIIDQLGSNKETQTKDRIGGNRLGMRSPKRHLL
jgi:hypothetical protein